MFKNNCTPLPKKFDICTFSAASKELKAFCWWSICQCPEAILNCLVCFFLKPNEKYSLLEMSQSCLQMFTALCQTQRQFHRDVDAKGEESNECQPKSLSCWETPAHMRNTQRISKSLMCLFLCFCHCAQDVWGSKSNLHLSPSRAQHRHCQRP